MGTAPDAFAPSAFAHPTTSWHRRGVSYERLGKWPQAEADFLKAMELDPDQPSVLNSLGFNWVDRNLKLKEGLARSRRP